MRAVQSTQIVEATPSRRRCWQPKGLVSTLQLPATWVPSTLPSGAMHWPSHCSESVQALPASVVWRRLGRRATELRPLPADGDAFRFVGDRGRVGPGVAVAAFVGRAACGQQADEEDGRDALDHDCSSVDGVAASLATTM